MSATRRSTVAGSSVAAGRVAVQRGASSYPGGKSGAGIYQRLINLIPPHRVFVSAFAGQCGVTRRIRPAEHTIVIDADESVCEWWFSWSRSPAGRSIEIHHCDAIEWIRYRFGQTEYSAATSGDQDRDAQSDGRGRRNGHRRGIRRREISRQFLEVCDASAGGSADNRREWFVFADPPYVLSERSHGKQYACELRDDDHSRLSRILSRIWPARALLCGYATPLYASLQKWRTVDHRVPTRGGLQDERIWMNYPEPAELHDYRYVGDCRRSRERIRRRQRNWLSQLNAMRPRERQAMLEALATSESEAG